MALKEIEIIPSKSFAHRAYICDLLAGEEGHGVICELESDDIRATRRCIEALKKGDDILDCGESGSTLRFMMPVAGVLGRDVSFVTRGRLSERPITPLEDELMAHGMEISHLTGGVIKASGLLQPGTYRLPGSISSQFVTGLLLSLPYLDGGSRIELTSELRSKAYVDITLSVLKDYGISIDVHDNVYDIAGPQQYSRTDAYHVEGDWSQAAFWFAAGAVGKDPVSVSGLNENSLQGDRQIVEALRSFGARIDLDHDEEGRPLFISYPSELTGEMTDVSEIPDLAPALAAAAAFANGDTRLINAERLRIKESDRILSIVNCLNSLGIGAEESENEIIIHGCGGRKPRGGTAETSKDHRIVMMAAVISLGTEGRTTIRNMESVNKSYPTFFTEFRKAFGGE